MIINNYSPKWRWIVVDIYRAAKRRGKNPPLFTDTEVNNCFSIYHTSWINSRLMTEKGLFSGGLLRCRSRAARIAHGEQFFIVKCSVSSSCRQIKRLQALVKSLRSHFLNGWVKFLLLLKPSWKKMRCFIVFIVILVLDSFPKQGIVFWFFALQYEARYQAYLRKAYYKRLCFKTILCRTKKYLSRAESGTQ